MPFDAVVLHLELLGNPVTKYRDGHPVEEIHEPTVHLLAYTLDVKLPAPPEQVIVRNQFTDAAGQPWQLGGTQFCLFR
ncbi:MAG TPA: hypothetical protein VG323_06930 [Thermoanaerobaculia bacterium]|nr:hypothetical protein [Thermoanaerobaculia bacterium]